MPDVDDEDRRPAAVGEEVRVEAGPVKAPIGPAASPRARTASRKYPACSAPLKRMVSVRMVSSASNTSFSSGRNGTSWGMC